MVENTAVWFNTYIITITLLSHIYGDGIVILSGVKQHCQDEYDKMLVEKTCSREGGFNQSQALKVLNNTSNDRNVSIPLYLTSVVIDLSDIGSIPVNLRPDINDEFTVTVFVGIIKQTSNFTYNVPRVYYALLREPIKLNVSTNFRFTVHKKNVNWHPTSIHLQHILATTYIAVNDFCNGSDACANITSKYRGYGEACSSIDQYDFIAKYGYCQNNPPPNITKYSGSIDWDAMKKNPQPTLLFSNYTWVEKKKDYEYELVNVESEISHETNSHVNTINHPDCHSSTVNVSYLMAYFCLNKMTGNIYSTKALAENIVPIDIFHLSIEIKNFNEYPPRSFIKKITLTAESICTEEYRAFRKLKSTTMCDHVSYNASIIKRNGHTNASVWLDIHSKDPSKLFYISGIWKINGSRRKYESNDINGINGINGSIRISFQNETYTTVRYDDRYRSFDPPLRYKPNDTISLYVYDASTNKRYSDFHIDEWQVILINDHNYCSVKQCIDLYKRYKSEYTKKDIERKCENEDSYGFQAKFGYCEDMRFIGSPTISRHIITGSNAILSNCIYSSGLKASDVYWLKDGTTWIGVNDAPINKELTKPYKVPDLNITNVTLADQGYYQCVVTDRQRTIKSNKVFLQLTDIAEYRVTVDINRQWDDRYTNTSTILYKDLSGILKTESVKPFKHDGATSEIKMISRHGHNTVLVTMVIVVSGATKSTRLKLCKDVKEIFKENGKLGNLIIANIKIINYDCCFGEYYGEDYFKGVYQFDTALSGTYEEAIQPNCTYGYRWGNATVKRQCLSNRTLGVTATWSDVDLSACQTKEEDTSKLLDLTKNITQDTVGEVAENASRIATKGSISNPKNIEIISEIITSVTKLNVSNINTATNILKCVGSILNATRTAVKKTKPGSCENVLKSLDILAQAQKPTRRGESKSISVPHIALVVVEPIPNKTLTIISQNGSQVDVVQEDNFTPPNTSKAFIHLPIDVVLDAGNNTIYSYVYESDNFFLSRDNQHDVPSKLGSSILSATVSNKNITNRQKPIEMGFTVSNETARNLTYHLCKFWDPNLSVNGSTTKGGWSTDGCNTTIGELNQIKCTCNHLTNFALILDVSGTEYNPPSLDWISNIGCGISMVCLILTIITNLMFKSIRKKVPAKILVNLSVSLFMTYLVFLAGVDRVKPIIGCRIVAMLLQYFLLATFFWMAIEGLNLYRNFVKVFSAGSTGKFLHRCYVMGWGGPLIITAATAGSRWKNMGNEKFCVLKGTVFYFALLLPICIILIANFLVLLLVLRGINGGSKIKSDTPKQKNKKIVKVRIAFACASLLGSTWVFAILAVGPLRDVFQWLFCIFNSLQGAFIFYFYTFRDKKAQQEWMTFINAKVTKDKYINSSSVVSKRSETSQMDSLDTSKSFQLPAFNLKPLRKKSTELVEKTSS